MKLNRHIRETNVPYALEMTNHLGKKSVIWGLGEVRVRRMEDYLDAKCTTEAFL